MLVVLIYLEGAGKNILVAFQHFGIFGNSKFLLHKVNGGHFWLFTINLYIKLKVKRVIS